MKLMESVKNVNKIVFSAIVAIIAWNVLPLIFLKKKKIYAQKIVVLIK